VQSSGPVKSTPPTNQSQHFYRPDALPVAQPTVQSTEGKTHGGKGGKNVVSEDQ